MKQKRSFKRCGSLVLAFVFAFSTIGTGTVSAASVSADETYVCETTEENVTEAADSTETVEGLTETSGEDVSTAELEASAEDAAAESTDEAGEAAVITDSDEVAESDTEGNSATENTGTSLEEDSETSETETTDGVLAETLDEEAVDEGLTEALDETAAQAATSSSVKFKSSGVTLSKTTYTYDGTKKTPKVTVKNTDGTTLVKNTDYTVRFYSNVRKYIGQYTVMIYGKGDYAGITVKKTFKIVPKKVTLSSVKSSEDSKLTVKWSKISGAERYQIAYKRKGSSSWKYTTTASVSKTLSSLTAGEKYTVKVRAYKTIDGTRYYGSWSSTKTVTVYKDYTETYEGSGIFSNGTYQYYTKKSSSTVYYLMRKTISSGTTKKLKKITLEDSYETCYVAAVACGNVYISREMDDEILSTYVYNISKGEIIKKYANIGIRYVSGKYAVLASMWEHEPMAYKHYLYRLTSTGMTKIKSLGYLTNAKFIGTKLYYASYTESYPATSLTVYRINRDGSSRKKLVSYTSSTYYYIEISTYSSSYCIVSGSNGYGLKTIKKLTY